MSKRVSINTKVVQVEFHDQHSDSEGEEEDSNSLESNRNQQQQGLKKAASAPPDAMVSKGDGRRMTRTEKDMEDMNESTGKHKRSVSEHNQRPSIHRRSSVGSKKSISSKISLNSSITAEEEDYYDNSILCVAGPMTGVPSKFFQAAQNCGEDEGSFVVYVFVRICILFGWTVAMAAICALIGASILSADSASTIQYALKLVASANGASVGSIFAAIACASVGEAMVETIGGYVLRIALIVLIPAGYLIALSIFTNTPFHFILVGFAFVVISMGGSIALYRLAKSKFGKRRGDDVSNHHENDLEKQAHSHSGCEHDHSHPFQDIGLRTGWKMWLVSQIGSIISSWCVFLLLSYLFPQYYTTTNDEMYQNMQSIALVFGIFRLPILVTIFPALFPIAFAI